MPAFLRICSKWVWTSNGFMHATYIGEFVTAGTDPFVRTRGHTLISWTATAKMTTGLTSECRRWPLLLLGVGMQSCEYLCLCGRKC